MSKSSRSLPISVQVEMAAAYEFIQVKPNRIYATDPLTFKDYITDGYALVDKSLLIKTILDHRSKEILITRPHRWGKTLNMEMIRDFFQPAVDDFGCLDSEKAASSRQLFCGNEKSKSDTSFKDTRCSRPLLISQADRGKYMNQQGQTPVAYIEFHPISDRLRHEQHDITFESRVKKAIQSSIHRMFNEHIYLLHMLSYTIKFGTSDNAKKQADLDLKTFHLLCTGYDNQNRTPTQEDLEMSIHFLTRLMHQHFKRKVILLVDDYDAPINSSIGLPCFSFVTDIMDRIYVNGFLHNEHVEKVVMIGTLPFATTKLSSLVDVIPLTVLNDTEFAEHFGLTDNEVNKLLTGKWAMHVIKIK